MKGSQFVSDYVHLLNYKYHKINQNLGGSYIGSRDWMKSKKLTISFIRKRDSKCFQYTIAVALDMKK